MSLSQRVKELRAGRELNQAELARLVGVGRNYIAGIEGGKIRLPARETMRALARALGTSSADLLNAAGYLPDSELEELPDAARDPELTLQLRRVAELPDPRMRRRVRIVLQQLLDIEAEEGGGSAGS